MWKRDREKIEDAVTKNAHTHLEHVLERIGRLLPSSYEMLMPFPHEKIEILILFSRYDTIMIDAFLVTRHGAPSVSMESFQ